MRIRIIRNLPPLGSEPPIGIDKGTEFDATLEPDGTLWINYKGEKVRLLKEEWEEIPETSNELHKSGDKQQYPAQPHDWDPQRGVIPTVRLISITPDPLGKLAFLNGTYKGVFYDSQEDPRITDQDRMQAWVDMHNTHLQAPLEAIKFHFRFDGVDRAFTHQLVRYRTAMFAQESLRFSVVGDLEHNVTLPPSLFGTNPSLHEMEDEKAINNSIKDIVESTEYLYASKEQRWRMLHDYTVRIIDHVYTHQIETGMPAEEARGLLPTEVATRINWLTDFRNMKEGAGQRLCTQAQFHWRLIWNGIVQAIAGYSDGNPDNDWQFQLMAQSSYFRPICYQLGRCPMKAEFDRACTIRERVDKLSADGVPSSQWENVEWAGKQVISSAEWLMDPAAARL